ncbi:MAG TPA: histidinol dehydrogenase [Gemmatimonadaceae bacterium]
MSATSSMAIAIAYTGPIDTLSSAGRDGLFERTPSHDPAVRERTAAIIARVRRDGDSALRALSDELDGVRREDFEVPRREWTRALDLLAPPVRRAMERAVENLARVHTAFAPCAVETVSEPGVIVGRRPDPLGRVGVYAPGGRASYPSSVLMGVVPARVAKVGEVIVCSPPTRETGRPADVILGAAALAGADRVFALGGAGAIAAMAYGTTTVPRVDRIVGPGNAYVAEAKSQVASLVAIDSPAGPSELLVLCDETADPALVARELLAQAEHDPLAAVVAVTTSACAAEAIIAELARQLGMQSRRAIAAAALARQGAVLWAASIDQAIAFANAYAAEHVLVVTADAEGVSARLRNAGSVFVGASASVAFGDYMTGVNHVLPTGGLARSYSGLSTLDFVRWTTYQRVTPAAAARLAGDVAVFAEAEGLPGHAAAARAWQTGGAA